MALILCVFGAGRLSLDQLLAADGQLVRRAPAAN
jgi:hypothetical protein